MKLTLLILAAVLLLALAGCDHPAWANYEIVVKNEDGDEVEGSPYYCISAPHEGATFYCKQPDDVVVPIEIKPGWKVQVWVLPRPMP